MSRQGTSKKNENTPFSNLGSQSVFPELLRNFWLNERTSPSPQKQEPSEESVLMSNSEKIADAIAYIIETKSVEKDYQSVQTALQVLLQIQSVSDWIDKVQIRKAIAKAIVDSSYPWMIAEVISLVGSWLYDDDIEAALEYSIPRISKSIALTDDPLEIVRSILDIPLLVNNPRVRTALEDAIRSIVESIEDYPSSSIDTIRRILCIASNEQVIDAIIRYLSSKYVESEVVLVIFENSIWNKNEGIIAGIREATPRIADEIRELERVSSNLSAILQNEIFVQSPSIRNAINEREVIERILDEYSEMDNKEKTAFRILIEPVLTPKNKERLNLKSSV